MSLCVSFLVGFAADCFLWVQYRLPKEQAVTGMPLLLNLGLVCFILFVLLSTASPALPQPEILLTSSSLVYFFQKKKKI